jgi:hypothetical protein
LVLRFLRIRFVASTPSTPGIAMSIRITSGFSAAASRIACSPSYALPTTSIRSSMVRIASSASAKSRWSSAMRTRIFDAVAAAFMFRAK